MNQPAPCTHQCPECDLDLDLFDDSTHFVSDELADEIDAVSGHYHEWCCPRPNCIDVMAS